MIEKLRIHLQDSFKVDGDIIDFRIYDGLIFSEILKLAKGTGRKVHGLDTFAGLNEPNPADIKHPNYNEIKRGQYFAHEVTTRSLIAKTALHDNVEIHKTNYKSFDGYSDLYCFALLDLKQYQPTKDALEYIWDRINYGGTIFISNFDDSQNHSQMVAIKDFLLSHTLDINVSRQMMVNGFKEKFVAIKCFNEKFKPNNFKDFHKRKKITVATVLKTGGDVYDYKYVNALAAAVKDNLSVDHEFVCLTDDPRGFSANVDRVVKFKHNYPKWWGKIELFDPSVFETDSILYMDLDTSIIGNINEIASYDGDFAGLRDFYALHSLGSGIMAWNKHKVSQIYDRFLPKANEVMRNYEGGDQVWIDQHKPSIEYVQDIYKNQVVSFKRHCFINNVIKVPENARIVCFHGNPRPHTIHHEVLKRYW